MMYVQQMAHLPVKTLDALLALIQKLDPTRFAVILHDKDTDKNGQPIAPHVHAMLYFENARTVTSVAKRLRDKPQFVEAWKGNPNNGFSYLVHETKGAKGGHQYDPSEVTANFDFPALLQQVGVEIEEAKASHGHSNTKTVLNLLKVGGITPEEAKAQLSGSELARCARQIDTVYANYLEEEARKFRATMKAEGRPLETFWLYGKSGTGKTSFSKDLAEKSRPGQPFYMAGSSRDPFQNYNGEHTIILDEFRPGTMAYHDFLRMTDPYSMDTGTMAPSRYHDKPVACDLIIITTPYDPVTFYKEQTNEDTSGAIDNIDQLIRRLSLVIRMSPDFIDLMDYDETQNAYCVSPGQAKFNPYSSKNRPTPPTDPAARFASLFS